MALCAARAQELGGGLVVARDGAVRGELRAPDRRAALRRAARGGRRGARAPAGPAARAGRRDRRAVHDALVPRAVGDPVAEDHRPRAGRRRRVRSSSRWSSTAGSSTTARRSWSASARSTSTRRGWPSAPGGRTASTASTSSTRRCGTRCTPRPRRRQARADPRASRPRREGRRAHRALARPSRPGSASTGSRPPSTSASWPPTPPTARSSGSRSWSACASTRKDSILANADAPAGQHARAGDRDRARRDRQDRAAAAGGRAVSLSTHVLDTVRGRPAAGVAIELRRDGERRRRRSTTDDDGRAPFGDVGGRRVRAGLRRRRLLRRGAVPGPRPDPLPDRRRRRALPRAAARLPLGVQHVPRQLLSRSTFALSGNEVGAQVARAAIYPAREALGESRRCRRPSPLPPGPAMRHRVHWSADRRRSAAPDHAAPEPDEPDAEPAHPTPAATARTVAAGVAPSPRSRCGRRGGVVVVSPRCGCSCSGDARLTFDGAVRAAARAASRWAPAPRPWPLTRAGSRRARRPLVLAVVVTVAWPLSGYPAPGRAGRVVAVGLALGARPPRRAGGAPRAAARSRSRVLAGLATALVRRRRSRSPTTHRTDRPRPARRRPRARPARPRRRSPTPRGADRAGRRRRPEPRRRRAEPRRRDHAGRRPRATAPTAGDRRRRRRRTDRAPEPRRRRRARRRPTTPTPRAATTPATRHRRRRDRERRRAAPRPRPRGRRRVPTRPPRPKRFVRAYYRASTRSASTTRGPRSRPPCRTQLRRLRRLEGRLRQDALAARPGDVRPVDGDDGHARARRARPRIAPRAPLQRHVETAPRGGAVDRRRAHRDAVDAIRRCR